MMRIPRIRRLLCAHVGLGWLLLADSAWAQCAMCQASAESTHGEGAAFNVSTLFMLSIPYLLALGVIGYVVYSHRHSRRQPDPMGPDHLTGPDPKD